MTDQQTARERKAALRRKARRARAQLSAEFRRDASELIADSVARSSLFRRARNIACYLPMRYEVDTWPLVARAWRMKKQVFAPVVGKNFSMLFREVSEESDIRRSAFGIPEPQSGVEISARALDLVLVPVIAFDRSRDRIGAGGGFYDRAFAYQAHRRLYFRPKLAGLAFECQRLEKIVTNPWDIRLFRIFTESHSYM